MATVSSAWAKPGAWALDSEEQEAMDTGDGENGRQFHHDSSSDPIMHQPLSDFPSLAAAATTKAPKKKKSQPMSLAEFSTGKQVAYGSGKSSSSQIKGLTTDELLLLPTGPRERTAEELERSSSRLGGGFNSYGSGPRRYPSDEPPRRYGSGSGSGSGSGDDQPRRGSVNNGPSRADEIDDWGASKRMAPPPLLERRDRDKGGFFDSQSRADESETWLSNKSSLAPPAEGRRPGSGAFEVAKERRGGFDIFHKEGVDGGADSDSWTKKKEEGGGGDSWGKKREEGSGGDSWGKKREEGSGGDSWGKKREEGSGGRPRLVLQPRTLPASNGDPQQGSTRSKGSNPFGEARPREEVLAEKGHDWKKIDEQLESRKIKEGKQSPVASDGAAIGKKSFGSGNGRANVPEDRAERTWRKEVSATDDTPRFAV
ncbi:hypothetical protein ACLOJK_000752 [Asimina triloba]